MDWVWRVARKSFSLLFGFLVTVGLAGTSGGQPPQDRWDRLGKVVTAHARHAEALLELPDVVGVGVGLDLQGQPVVKVFAKKPRPEGVPGKLDGADVEVIPSGAFYALVPPATAARSTGKKTPTDKAPTVQFQYPQYGQTLLGNVTLRANAADDKGVTKVEFYYQEYDTYYSTGSRILLATDTNGADGWTCSWATSALGDARYILWAVAYDTSSQSATHNVTVFVDNVAGEPPAYSPDRPDDWPIAPIGVSVGNQYEASAGTVGCRVRDSSGTLYILSNNHVLALENTAPLGSWILQPGLYDSQIDILYAWQRVGRLTAYFPITFSRRASNTVDAALAAVEYHPANNSPLVGMATPGDGYGTPASDHLTNSELAALFASSPNGIPVHKYGRTTRWTNGLVTSINTTIIVGYSRGQARFVNQIIVQSSGAFILPGDSGSLLVTQDGNIPAGLLFAGNSSGTYGVANRIEDVLTTLGQRLGRTVTIDGASGN